MCLALRYFATGANYSIIGDFQGVHKSSVSHCVREVATFLYVRQQEYIHFPLTPEEKYRTAQRYFESFGQKPLCLGCMDGTHIPIIRPRLNEDRFVNRKNYHSINTMVSKLTRTQHINKHVIYLLL